MPINGTVQTTGEFAPSASGDTYAILDAKYMRDGFRNVETIADLDLITEDRRIAGMVVGVSGGTAYYKLGVEPWSYNISDWTPFASTDIYVTGATLSTGYTLTLSRNDNNDVTVNLAGLASDVYVVSGVYNENTGVVTFTNSTGGTFNVSGFTTGMTQYWTSGSTGTYSIKANNDSGLDATGNYAYAEGNGNIASGIASHAEGGNTIASANYSHAEGRYSIASGIGSHAEGGFTTANGLRSHAEGYSTEAIGVNSHAEGSDTLASGTISHAEGNFTTASGRGSHSEGNLTTASGDYSHSEGSGTTASGIASHSEGSQTTAFGDYSHAGGSYSQANGISSFVHGNNSVAAGNSTIVLGENITGLADNTVYVPYFNIKNFTGTTAIAGLAIDIDGNVITGNTAPSIVAYNGLSISGTSDIILGGNLITPTTIGASSSNQLEITDNWGTMFKSRDTNGNFLLGAIGTPSISASSLIFSYLSDSGTSWTNSNIAFHFGGACDYLNATDTYNFGDYTQLTDTSVTFNMGRANTYQNTGSITVVGNNNNLSGSSTVKVFGDYNTINSKSNKVIIGNYDNDLIVDGNTGILNSLPTLINSGLTGTLIGITSTGDFYNTNINLTNLIFTGGTVTGNTYFTANVTASTFSSLLISNTRLRKRFVSVASSATPAVNTDNGDVFSLTGLSTNITNASTYLTGTPTHGDLFSLELTDNGVARTISWGASFSNTGTLSLPTTTVISTLLRCLFQYNSVTTKWEIVAVV